MNRPALPERVVLVGFMAAGKSTVGPLLARELGYRFVDMDAEVERRAGASVRRLFETEGEAAFRELEAEVTRALDQARHVVVAAGGGWMARPELRDRWPDAVRLWLRAEPDTILARLGDATASRPLLGEEPADAVRRLSAEREAAYARAELAVRTDGRSPAQVARRALEALLRRSQGARSGGDHGDDARLGVEAEPFSSESLTSQDVGPGAGEETGTVRGESERP